mmetsp:Transcript_36261/g.51308  ORF Transcript_36261/g.51308 Transcript_36261/m.51308 type:complete len:116 (+) Transcript_36261:216-563(+)
MDEWPVHSVRFNPGRVGPVIVEKQTRTREERCSVANRFMEQFGMSYGTTAASYEFLVDDPDLGEPFERLYAPWPMRMYIVRGRRIEWIAEPEGASYEKAAQELLRRLQTPTVCCV